MSPHPSLGDVIGTFPMTFLVFLMGGRALLHSQKSCDSINFGAENKTTINKLKI